MSEYARAASAADRAHAAGSKPGLTAASASGERPVESSSAARNWAWGSTREPYDWMDAHTPCDNLSVWR